jgi:hypothetical protein
MHVRITHYHAITGLCTFAIALTVAHIAVRIAGALYISTVYASISIYYNSRASRRYWQACGCAPHATSLYSHAPHAHAPHATSFITHARAASHENLLSVLPDHGVVSSIKAAGNSAGAKTSLVVEGAR